MDELIVGTYEGFLLGYTQYNDEDKKLKQSFATHSHTGSVRCLTIAGNYMASGGTDDKIIVIDLKTRKEHTVLMHHDGTVNALSFTSSASHLLSGSDDGSLVVTRVGNWQIEKIWKKAHGGQPVNAVAVHPSDKLALSIGGDKTLRTWNLIKGRPAFTINLASKGVNMATEITFAPKADRFSLISQQTVDIWTISKSGIEKRITCNTKPTSVQWADDEKIIVGLDNGNVIMLNVSDSEALTCSAHKQRVKCIHYENNRLYSASSSGEIKVWSLVDAKSLTEHSSASAGCRVTCMALNRQSHLIKKEDQSDSDEKKEVENVGEDAVNSDLSEEEKSTPKKKPGSFVAVSYDNEEEDTPPPHKKIKRKKHSKRNKKKVNE